MILYIIKSTLCVAAFLGFYHLLLERESMFKFNRIFLLGGLVFSFLIPILSVFSTIIPLEPGIGGSYIFESFDNSATASVPNPILETSFTIYVIYALITATLFIRFAIQLVRLVRKVKGNEKIALENSTIVLIKESIVPHTFCNYIFINKAAIASNKIEPEVFTHELTHVKQAHSIDIILVEILRIIFWFNPVLPFYKRAIQSNHEYLADQEVIIAHQNIRHYQHILLSKITWDANIQLASNFTYILTKKRLKMMTKHTQKLRANFFVSATFPLMAALILLFGKTTVAQQDATIQNPEVRAINDNYFKDAVFVCPNDEGKKIYTPYAALSEKEKSKIPPPPPKADSKNNREPLPKGTIVALTDDGQIRVMKNSTAPPPPPPPPAAPVPPSTPHAPSDK